VRDDELTVLRDALQDPEVAGEFVWAGYSDQQRWRRRFAEDGLVGKDGGVLLVTSAGDEPLGMVSFGKQWVGSAVFCWEVGIALLAPARGRGYGTAAQRELVRYLFAHTTANRIEATTETGNRAEQRALEKAGFTREGILRGRDWRAGQWRDVVIYAIVRADPLP
jgi:RimJ/RimL family protein N-acetyltransferase